MRNSKYSKISVEQEIFARFNNQIVGTYERKGSFGFVLPDNPKISRDIYIERGCDLGANSGYKVLCTVNDYGSVNKNPSGIITEIIGTGNEPNIDIISTAKSFGIPDSFPEDVIANVKEITKEVSDNDKKGRLDLSDELIISIDGDDSKDLDDAVSLYKDGDDYILGVHIADVSHYVKENTPLDKEAFKRSTSVYLIDVVIPMLPKLISNGICSLLQDVCRLTLSCIMRINKRGEVVDSKIKKSFIVNKNRMTYKDVNRILEDKNSKEAILNSNVVEMLYLMEELRGILDKRRKKFGTIDFEIQESKIKLNKRGFPIEIKAANRGKAEMLIEQFMLCANETVAKTANFAELPFIYRTHPEPDKEKLLELSNLCALFGIRFNMKKKKVTPKEISRVLNDIKGREYEAMMSTIILRTMQQAKYSNEDCYHFGLALDCYCHFTSPIRRYPDLLVHRILKENMKKPLGSRRRKHYNAILPMAAEQTSRLERRAIECEREVDKLKKCQYMERRIGEVYDGYISGVTSWGLYVMLPNTVEGMIPLRFLKGDYFLYNEKGYEVIGERTGKRYRLGDSVRVYIVKADSVSRNIDFDLV